MKEISFDLLQKLISTMSEASGYLGAIKGSRSASDLSRRLSECAKALIDEDNATEPRRVRV